MEDNSCVICVWNLYGIYSDKDIREITPVCDMCMNSYREKRI